MWAAWVVAGGQPLLQHPPGEPGEGWERRGTLSPPSSAGRAATRALPRQRCCPAHPLAACLCTCVIKTSPPGPRRDPPASLCLQTSVQVSSFRKFVAVRPGRSELALTLPVVRKGQFIPGRCGQAFVVGGSAMVISSCEKGTRRSGVRGCPPLRGSLRAGTAARAAGPAVGSLVAEPCS